jgi:hypothetical protein
MPARSGVLGDEAFLGDLVWDPPSQRQWQKRGALPTGS